MWLAPRRATRGCQPCYSDLAIETALTLGRDHCTYDDDQDAGDASQVKPLLNQIDVPIGQFTADGAYDGKPTNDAVTDHSAAAVIVIPPRPTRSNQPAINLPDKGISISLQSAETGE